MICKALMHEPVLLFLDEPTAGVDVELREELWQYVRELRDRGTTIVLTTHYIEEAEELADRVGIINDGRLLRVAPRDELMEEFGTREVEVCLTHDVPDGFVESLGGLDVKQVGADRLAVVVEEREAHSEGASPVEQLLRAVLDADLGIDFVEGGRTSLEEIFRKLVSDDKTESSKANKEVS